MLGILKKILLSITSFIPETLLLLFTKYKVFMSMLLLTILPVALKFSYYVVALQFLEFLDKNITLNLQQQTTSSLPCQFFYFVSAFKIDSIFSILMSAYITSLVLSLVKFK